jgi:hypothetical protein
VKRRQRRFRTRRTGALVTALASTGCGRVAQQIRFQHRCFSHATFTGSQSFSVWASIGGRLAGSQLKMSNRVPNGHRLCTQVYQCAFLSQEKLIQLIISSGGTNEKTQKVIYHTVTQRKILSVLKVLNNYLKKQLFSVRPQSSKSNNFNQILNLPRNAQTDGINSWHRLS